MCMKDERKMKDRIRHGCTVGFEGFQDEQKTYDSIFSGILQS